MKSRWRSPSTMSLKAPVSTPTSSRERTGSAGHRAGERADRPRELSREHQAQEKGADRPGRRALEDRHVQLAQAVEEDVDLVVETEKGRRAALGVDDGRHRADPRAAGVAIRAGIARDAV